MEVLGQLQDDSLCGQLLLLVGKQLSPHYFVVLEARHCMLLAPVGMEAHCCCGLGSYYTEKDNTSISLFCKHSWIQNLPVL